MLRHLIPQIVSQGKHLIFLLLTLLLLICCEKQRAVSDLIHDEPLLSGGNQLLDNEGDTIFTGVPVSIESRPVQTSGFSGRSVASLRPSQKVVSAYPYSSLAGEPQMTALTGVVQSFTPGQEGLSPPDTFSVTRLSISALQSKPVVAMPLQMQDNAARNIQYLSVEEGLTDYYIHSILEDSRGFLWLNTTNGTLTRYDGRRFIFFPSPESLPAHTFTKYSMEDREGNLWFSTRTGLARYDGDRFTYFHSDNGFKYNGVTVLLQDRQGRIWFGTNDRGLGCLDFSGEGVMLLQYTTASGISHNRINDLLEDRKGHIWIGTGEGGAMRFDGETFFHYTTADGLSHNAVNAILEDSRGRIWFGTEGGGACRFDGDAFARFTTAEGLSGNLVRDIFEDSKGHYWFGTYNHGLNHFDGNRFTHFKEENGIKSAHINTILEDSFGNLWIGTDEGVHRFGVPEFQHFTAVLNCSVNAIEEDEQGRLWFGVSGRAQNDLICLDGEEFHHFSGKGEHLKFPKAGIYSLSKDSRGDLWLGNGDSGVIQFDPNAPEPRLLQFDIGKGWSNFLLSILEDSEGERWFGTFDGMNRFDGNSFLHYNTPATPGLDHNLVHSLTEDDNGSIWFGHPQYLGRYADQSFVFYTKKEGLPHNMVHAMLKDSRGHLWVGTEGGLSCYDGEVFRNYTKEDGLINERVYSLVEDRNQRIWAGTQNGLILLVSPEAGGRDRGSAAFRDYRIFNFGKPDGLKQADFLFHSVHLDSQNRIWWGKTKGAMMLDLDQFEIPVEPPKIHLDHVEVNQQFIAFQRLSDTSYAASISFGKKLRRSFETTVPFFNYPAYMTLPYSLNHLTFQFSGIDLAAPQKIRYSFRLDGFDENWSIPQAEAKAEYRNLPHGDYTLKVKAMGAAQLWSEPFEYSFSIRPPWWYTWWAYFLYTLAVFSVLTGLYLYQRRRWQLQTQLEVAREKAVRLKEIDQFKSRFYTNITHEFRTPLTVINGMTGQIEGHEKIKTLIHRNSDRLLQMVNQLLDLSKLENESLPINWVQADVVPYLKYLTESCHSLAGSKKINLAFFSGEKSLEMDFDEEKLQQILLNLLSNAIKFTPEYGSVKVVTDRIEIKGNPFLQLEVSDTGPGIPEEQLPLIFNRFYQAPATWKGEGTSGIGLALVKELVQLLSGTIKVKSEVGRGSSFRVCLPIHRKAAKKGSAEWLVPANTAGEEALTANQPAMATALESAEKPLVLIIEDNADVVTYLTTCLGDQYDLQVARNGKEGMEKALESIPDVILCDVMMPEMDGFEACSRLKADRRSSHIPIILLTAKATQEDKVTGLTMGADAYLTKPFDKKELLVRLDNLVVLSKRLQERLLYPETFQKNLSEMEQREAAFLQELNQVIESNLDDELFDTNRLCRVMAMSRSQLHRKIKALTGQPTASYIRFFRLRKARYLLENSDLPIGEIALQVGYKDASHFSRSFSREFDMKPSDVRK